MSKLSIIITLGVLNASIWIWGYQVSDDIRDDLRAQSERLIASEHRVEMHMERFGRTQLGNAQLLGGIDVKLDDIARDAWEKNRMFTKLNVDMGLELSRAMLVSQEAVADNLETQRRLGSQQKQLNELGTAVLGHVNREHGR